MFFKNRVEINPSEIVTQDLEPLEIPDNFPSKSKIDHGYFNIILLVIIFGILFLTLIIYIDKKKRRNKI